MNEKRPYARASRGAKDLNAICRHDDDASPAIGSSSCKLWQPPFPASATTPAFPAAARLRNEKEKRLRGKKRERPCANEDAQKAPRRCATSRAKKKRTTRLGCVENETRDRAEGKAARRRTSKPLPLPPRNALETSLRAEATFLLLMNLAFSLRATLRSQILQIFLLSFSKSRDDLSATSPPTPASTRCSLNGARNADSSSTVVATLLHAGKKM
ncbi:hypothetical protein BESB_029330 [Besnoitia besnoiti]|uniref:Uncharacterized protein n=1 Tax=Besnoitia besnoiti TaxID=94643 RepID=A0A2A9LYH9_BESBE|nr:uncharacterized protein BESB_029330 [Besnoitia besnoiti]PFH31498.1 hypothetical protein BESB_029330 [Besnoitia besnoiti]